jgi:hypothetical protein
MIRWLRLAIGIGVIAAITVVATGATAGADGRSDGAQGTLRERLTGYEENPLTLSTTGTGEFRARIGPGNKITYSLRYSALEGAVTQAHIHFGSPSQVGGISVFFCSNLGNGPAGTQACPPAPATVTGTVRPADVIGPAGQGVPGAGCSDLPPRDPVAIVHSEARPDAAGTTRPRGSRLHRPRMFRRGPPPNP